MATSTSPPRIGPADHGRRVSFAAWTTARFEPGWHYELSRGVVVVTNVPGISHGLIVLRLVKLLILYDATHPGVIAYLGGGSDCRLPIPGLRSDRHPDQAIYLLPPPADDDNPWMRWIPQIVVEVISRGSARRDLVLKRAEYLRLGISEYWIVDPRHRHLIALTRAGDQWAEARIAADTTYQTHLLPGFQFRPADLLGPVAGR